MTSAPGRSMVLIRPPSLEPSTPDVREPREWVTSRNSTWSGLSGRRGSPPPSRRSPACRCPGPCRSGPAGPGVAVDLADVGAAVLVGLLDPAPSLLLAEVLALHYHFRADGLGGTPEDMARALQPLE